MTDPFADLDRIGFGTWQSAPLRGDASTRRFARLTGPAGASAIAMFTPPDQRDSQDRFLAIGAVLRSCGLAAPDVLASDADAGLLVLEDLGANDVASSLRNRPMDAPVMYRAAIDVLVHLRAAAPLPPNLVPLTSTQATRMLDPFFADFAGMGPDEIPHGLMAGIEEIIAPALGSAQVLSLRDYHSENLIWRPEKEGLSRVGLVDFQDAFAAPAEYDLVSLLWDARRDVGKDMQHLGICQFAEATGQTVEDVGGRCAVLGVQRNLRILGIFARLAHKDGKTGYLSLIPRVRGHVREALRASVWAPVRGALLPMLDRGPA